MKKLSPFALLAVFVSALILAFVSAIPAHAQQNNTIYQLPADGLGQLSGANGARVLRPTFAATLTLNQSLGIVHQINGDSATSSTCTVSVGNGGQFGQLMIVICTASGASTVTYTFDSTYFKPTATAAPTTGKSITVAYVSDGTYWREFSRSASAQ